MTLTLDVVEWWKDYIKEPLNLTEMLSEEVVEFEDVHMVCHVYPMFVSCIGCAHSRVPHNAIAAKRAVPVISTFC